MTDEKDLPWEKMKLSRVVRHPDNPQSDTYNIVGPKYPNESCYSYFYPVPEAEARRLWNLSKFVDHEDAKAVWSKSIEIRQVNAVLREQNLAMNNAGVEDEKEIERLKRQVEVLRKYMVEIKTDEWFAPSHAKDALKEADAIAAEANEGEEG